MEVFDLTQIVHPAIPVFPGTKQPVFNPANTLAKDGFIETKITMYSHTGTHIDAPAHLLSNGRTLDKFDLSHFIGRAVVLDFSSEKYTDLINLEDLIKYKNRIENKEFIIIKTGWSRYWGEKKYFENFPALSLEAAVWLSGFSLKGFGIDAISIDAIESTTFLVHKELLKKNIIIVENLTNINFPGGEDFTFFCLPMKIKNADGAPARAAAVIL